jgi:hypothetical protein
MPCSVVLSYAVLYVQDGGAGDANEIDLDKEAEADAGRKKAKRQRFERYEDDFIDDSEIEKVKGGPKVKTQHTGFYVNVVSHAHLRTAGSDQRTKHLRACMLCSKCLAGHRLCNVCSFSRTM